MTPQDADPLYIDPEAVWESGRDVGFEDGLVAGRKLKPYQAAICILLGAVIGSLATLLVEEVAAAPRSAEDVIPAVVTGSQGSSGNLPRPTGAPRAWVAQLAEHRLPYGQTEVAGSTPAPGSGAPFSGIASWYPADGLIAAAGPGLRHGRWRGSKVVVSANGRHVTVRLADWCQCYGSRLLDLSDDAFRRLVPLSRGLVRVTVTPAAALPETDR